MPFHWTDHSAALLKQLGNILIVETLFVCIILIVCEPAHSGFLIHLSYPLVLSEDGGKFARELEDEPQKCPAYKKK